jgi:hypothetical protein
MNGAIANWVLALVLASGGQEPAVVSGVVKDAGSGKVLPRYLLELHGGSRFDRVTSDDGGRFASSVPFGVGEIEVRCVDDDAIERRLMQGGLQLVQFSERTERVPFDGKPMELSVAAGPTFRLKWKSPAMEGSPTTPAISSAEIVWKQESVLDPDITLRAGVRIEADGSSWVRFAPLPKDAPAGKPRLRVVSVDGKWKAESVLAGLEGADVDVEWKPCARWVGALVGPDGRGVGSTWVRLERLDEKKSVIERRRTRCDAKGGYAFDALDAGMWRMSGDPLRFHAFQSEVREVAAGTVSKLKIDLDAERDFKSIEGRIEGVPVEEGRAVPGEPTIIVRRAGDPLPQETLNAGWRLDGGRYVALFVVPRLPSGQYELELVPAPGDAGKWSALKMAAKPGGTVIFAQR